MDRRDADSDSSEQLRALNERFEQMREAERTRIARELHDELGQLLTGIKLDFASSVRRFRECRIPPDIVERVQSAMMQVDLAIAMVQRIASDLRPAALDHRDLAGAMQYEAMLVSTRAGIPIRVVNRIDADVPPALGTAAFRVFQEALLNAVRHAQATQIVVRIRTRASRLIVFVRDNGIGCPDLSRSASLGITGMQERARSAGGTLTIRGRRGRGTLVALHLPFGSHV